MLAMAIVAETVIDRGVFMPSAKQMTGQNHVTKVDEKPGLSRLLDDMRILEDFAGTDMGMATAISHISILVGGFTEDIDEFIAYTRGMPHMHTIKIERTGIRGCVISGSLDQWRTAVVAGCAAPPVSPIRVAFNKIYQLFVQRGLDSLFQDFKIVEAANKTFLLESK